MKKALLSLIILLSAFYTYAQPDEQRFGVHSIEANYYFGKIIRHSPKFALKKITDYSHGFELAWYMQTTGKKDWQRKMRYPEVGAMFLFLQYGNNNVFGNAYEFMMASKFWLYRNKVFGMYVTPATGFAVVPGRYHPVDNPMNTAIGSLLNLAVLIKLGFEFKPSPYLHINVAGTFTHISNSGMQMPNLGINMPALVVGVKYFPVVKPNSYNRGKWPKPKKKNEYMVRFGASFNERDVWGGPKYPVYTVSAAYARYTSIINKVWIGATYEFSQSVYDYMRYGHIESKYKRAGAASNFSFYVADEILLGKVGMYFGVGAYAFYPVFKEDIVYGKLGINYYFVSMGKEKNTKMFLGSYVKVHKFRAQFNEFCLGVVF
jgi:hypothetical protein